MDADAQAGQADQAAGAAVPRMSADQSPRALFTLAGVASILFVVLSILALVLDFLAPPPVEGGAETLRFIAGHKVVYIVEQILWILPDILPVLTFVALFVALSSAGRGLALPAAILGGLPWALLLAVPVTSRGSLNLVYLSDQYTAAATAHGRSVFSTAAESIIAENNTAGLLGVLCAVGILLISLVMLTSTFPRALAWLGILTGALGVVSEALRFVAPAFYAGYGLLMWAWFVAVGVTLIRLAARAPSARRQHA